MKTTESPSKYRHLEKKSIAEILQNINQEDKTVPDAVEKAIPQIENLVQHLVPKLQDGGRLFYIGSGTSGRLGILDASECPPTFGVSSELIIGLIAGGDAAIRKAQEYAEDDAHQAFKDLEHFNINSKDTVIGIAASGTTPYVIGGLQDCQAKGISTGCITCNVDTPLAKVADFPIEVVVGAEFVTGSTRMKAGTAQKLVLNMISTTAMIQLGRVQDNRMVDMQLSNQKLVERGTKMIMASLNVEYEQAKSLLLKHGSVRVVLEKN